MFPHGNCLILVAMGLRGGGGSSNHKENVTSRTDGRSEVTALIAKRSNAEPTGGDGQTSE